MALKLVPPGRRKNNRFYLLKGRIDGRQYEVSTKTANRRDAEDFRDRFAVLVRRSPVDRRRAQTFAGAADLYLKAKRPSKNERRYIEKLKSHFGRQKLSSILPADIANAAHRLYPGCKNETKNRQVFTPVASILHYAAKNKLCEYQVVEKLKEDAPEPRRLGSEKWAELIANTDDPDMRLLLIFIAYQGWRISEAVRLKWEKHVNLKRQTLLVYIRKARRWKEVPMHPAVFEALSNRTVRQGKVFRWQTRSGPQIAKAEIEEKTGIDFTFHQARHDLASDLNERGATNRQIMETSTWISEKSVARYTNVNIEEARAALVRLPVRGQGAK